MATPMVCVHVAVICDDGLLSARASANTGARASDMRYDGTLKSDV